MSSTSDTRITGYEPLFSPAALLDELPLTDEAAATVERSRSEVRAVLDGDGRPAARDRRPVLGARPGRPRWSTPPAWPRCATGTPTTC